MDVVLSGTELRANVGVVFRSLGPGTNLFVKLEPSTLNPNGLVALGLQEDGAITYLARRTGDIGFDNGDRVRVLVAFAGPDVLVRVSTGEEIEHRLAGADEARFGASTRHGLRVNVAPDDDDGRSTFDDFEFSPRKATRRR